MKLVRPIENSFRRVCQSWWNVTAPMAVIVCACQRHGVARRLLERPLDGVANKIRRAWGCYYAPCPRNFISASVLSIYLFSAPLSDHIVLLRWARCVLPTSHSAKSRAIFTVRRYCKAQYLLLAVIGLVLFDGAMRTHYVHFVNHSCIIAWTSWMVQDGHAYLYCAAQLGKHRKRFETKCMTNGMPYVVWCCLLS